MRLWSKRPTLMGLYVVRRLTAQLTGFSLTKSLRKKDGNTAEAHFRLELEFRQDDEGGGSPRVRRVR